MGKKISVFKRGCPFDGKRRHFVSGRIKAPIRRYVSMSSVTPKVSRSILYTLVYRIWLSRYTRVCVGFWNFQPTAIYQLKTSPRHIEEWTWNWLQRFSCFRWKNCVTNSDLIGIQKCNDGHMLRYLHGRRRNYRLQLHQSRLPVSVMCPMRQRSVWWCKRCQ